MLFILRWIDEGETRMKELNMEFHTKYCVCCGELSEEIWRGLHEEGEKRPKSESKMWKGHVVFGDADYFYDTNKLKFCGACGVELKEGDVLTEREASAFWGAPCSEEIVIGYKCSNCGYLEQF